MPTRLLMMVQRKLGPPPRRLAATGGGQLGRQGLAVTPQAAPMRRKLLYHRGDAAGGETAQGGTGRLAAAGGVTLGKLGPSLQGPVAAVGGGDGVVVPSSPRTSVLGKSPVFASRCRLHGDRIGGIYRPSAPPGRRPM
jgi:hypothetical protein